MDWQSKIRRNGWPLLWICSGCIASSRRTHAEFYHGVCSHGDRYQWRIDFPGGRYFYIVKARAKAKADQWRKDYVANHG